MLFWVYVVLDVLDIVFYNSWVFGFDKGDEICWAMWPPPVIWILLNSGLYLGGMSIHPKITLALIFAGAFLIHANAARFIFLGFLEYHELLKGTCFFLNNDTWFPFSKLTVFIFGLFSGLLYILAFHIMQNLIIRIFLIIWFSILFILLIMNLVLVMNLKRKKLQSK